LIYELRFSIYELKFYDINSRMKFAILTDIHLGPEQSYKGILRKINNNAKDYLHNFINEINSNVKPEFVIVLGDLIQDDNAESDKNNLTYIVNLLTKLECPVYYAAGNHDLKNISEDELMKLFRQNSLFYSFDSDNYHCVVLFSKRIKKGNTIIEDEQKKWLEGDLKDSKKQCIVFVHHGLADQDLTGNPWFEGRPEDSLIANRKEIREILEQSNKVLAVFNSHLHWDKKNTHNNIPYFTIQSLVENEGDKGVASEAYAIVDIVNDKIDVEIKGKYSKKFSATQKF
jgi:3',5'-cyclic-AMP phosphodiesterase